MRCSMQFTDKLASMLPEKYSQLGWARILFLFDIFLNKNCGFKWILLDMYDWTLEVKFLGVGIL